MAVGVNPKKVKPYILKSDRESANPTKFFLRRLTGTEYFDLENRSFEINGKRVLRHQSVSEGVGRCLAGWENLIDEDGEQIPFVPNPDNPAEVVRFLDVATLNELWHVICEAATLSEDDRKNSESPST